MTAKDQLKIMVAGFRIIRPDFTGLRIKTKGFGGHEWHTLEKGFASKAALERRISELLNDPLTVED